MQPLISVFALQFVHHARSCQIRSTLALRALIGSIPTSVVDPDASQCLIEIPRSTTSTANFILHPELASSTPPPSIFVFNFTIPYDF
jgi:hypothetical protein